MVRPSGKTEMIAANRAQAEANRQARAGSQQVDTQDKRNKGSKQAKSLRYPYRMLDNNTDYLKIEIAEYQPPGLGLGGNDQNFLGLEAVTNEKGEKTGDLKFDEGQTINKLRSLSLRTGTAQNRDGLKNPKSTILLPIPQQLSDVANISWGDGGLNPIEAFGVAATSALMSSANPLKIAQEAVRILGDKGMGAIGDSNLRSALTSALAGAAVGTLGGNVSANQLVARATGQVLNPNLELLFDGVSLRSFPFTFEFFPRNQREAKEVMLIIRTLKRAMSARGNSKSAAGEGIFISSPDVFQVTYMKGKNPHPFLNGFKPMALTGMSMNYTGSNTYSTFPDGTPTHMMMQLTFKELNPIYAEDYDTGKGRIGVGY